MSVDLISAINVPVAVCALLWDDSALCQVIALPPVILRYSMPSPTQEWTAYSGLRISPTGYYCSDTELEPSS